MALHLDYKNKQITVIGDWNVNDLTKETEGKEDWKIQTENGIQLTIRKKRKYVYPYQPV